MYRYIKDLDFEVLIELGVQLGLKRSTLRRSSAHSLAGDLIQGWLRRDYRVLDETGEPTWQSLANALEAVGLVGIAHDIIADKVTQKSKCTVIYTENCKLAEGKDALINELPFHLCQLAIQKSFDSSSDFFNQPEILCGCSKKVTYVCLPIQMRFAQTAFTHTTVYFVFMSHVFCLFKLQLAQVTTILKYTACRLAYELCKSRLLHYLLIGS